MLRILYSFMSLFIGKFPQISLLPEARLGVNRLEDIITPATLVWTGAAGDLWSNKEAWEIDEAAKRAPKGGDTVKFKAD